MRRAWLRLLPGLLPLVLCTPAAALVMGGQMRVHAVIGQPLAVIVPLSFSGPSPGGVEVQVAPEPGLPEAEEAVAESVRASYDAKDSLIRLSTTQRVVVPAMRLHLTVSSGAFFVEQGFDVLVDLPDFNRQYERGEAGADREVLQQVETTGIRLLTIPGEKRMPAWGDAAARDAARPAPANDRPQPGRATPSRPPATYAVQAHDTLSTIAARLAKTYRVAAAPMKLALYESNPQAFRPAQPEHPLAGAQLQVPDKLEVVSQPASRVVAFGKFTSHPDHGWQVASAPAFAMSLGEARTDPAQGRSNRAQDALLRGALVAAAAASATLFFAMLLSRLRRLRLPRMNWPSLSLLKLKRNGMATEAVAPLVDPALRQEIGRLRDMLVDKPWRSDIRFQLAQRLYKAGDAAGFAEVAPELKSSLNVGVWQRVRLMGQELLRNDPRFV